MKPGAVYIRRRAPGLNHRLYIRLRMRERERLQQEQQQQDLESPADAPSAFGQFCRNCCLCPSDFTRGSRSTTPSNSQALKKKNIRLPMWFGDCNRNCGDPGRSFWSERFIKRNPSQYLHSRQLRTEQSEILQRSVTMLLQREHFGSTNGCKYPLSSIASNIHAYSCSHL